MKRLFASVMILAIGISATAQNTFGYENPIIKGFNPDPSVCRAGDDYYLVTSSFQYFPGVPLYHSKDLINWEQIGHVLTRESQLPLKEARSWNGIYAPTIRYNNGKFYMITTNVTSNGNFIVTATDPRGAWSEPILLDMPGIDPSLFWDDDGRCYYCGAADGITFCEINPDTGEKLSTPKTIWYGTGGRYPEAPHIYKKDGWYYLMIAEGGTEFAHGVTIARSRKIDGPYDPAPHNPILTHCKEKTQTNPIQGTGHADIVQAHDGSWWMVCLGFRTQSGNHHLMGRETFIAPVRWDTNAWPVVNGSGDLSMNMNVPTLPQKEFEARPARNEFRSPAPGQPNATMTPVGLGPEWSWIRNPEVSRYAIKDGSLRLYGSPADLDILTENPTFVGYRQQDINFTAETCLSLGNARKNDKAGMTVFMDTDSHYDIYLKKTGSKTVLCVTYALGFLRHTDEFPINTNKVYMRITGDGDSYSFSYSTDGKTFKEAGKGNTRYLSSETAGGFTGVMIGLWAQSPTSTGYADFDYFEYRK